MTQSAPSRSRQGGSALIRVTWILVAVAVVVLLAVASVSFGSRDVTWDQIVSALSGHSDTFAEAAILKRVPRTVLAILVGAVLAVAGATLQAVTRNPLADPGILGISAGASLAVVISIVVIGIAAPWQYITAATCGAAVSAVLVYSIGSLGRGGATPLKLVLAGAATTAAFTSFVSAILLPRVAVLQDFRFWQIGGVGGATWERIAVVGPVLIVGVLVCATSARGLNSLALGDDMAAGLGVNVRRTRLIAAAGAVLLAGAATAIAGPIGFVGLIVPHLCRLLIGPDNRWLIPFAALVGAALLTAADVVGRVLPTEGEIEVGIVTAFIGAPFFIWIVRRQKVREL